MSEVIDSSLDIEWVFRTLIRADADYRAGKVSELTDEDFDSLEEYARRVQPDHPYFLKGVDDDSQALVESAEHYAPHPLTIHMGSQNKALNKAELDDWISNVEGQELFASLKQDGSSCEITYKKGKFTRALTRGDGLVGRDITQPASMIPNIPKELQHMGTLVVRGEIMLSTAGFIACNEALKAEGKEEFTAERNAAVAIYRTELNWRFAKHLHFVAFDVETVEE